MLNQECGIQIPLDFPPIWHDVPPLGEFLLIVLVVQVVILTGLRLPGIDSLEGAAVLQNLLLKDFEFSYFFNLA